MKKITNPKFELNEDSILRSNKLALIFWSLIQNNIASTAMFCVCILIDFILQLIMIICIYKEFDTIPINIQNLI